MIETLLLLSCLLILSGSIFITFKTRFIQLRCNKILIKQLFSRQTEASNHTIAPRRALFTAMSTTLGISTIVGPIIAIYLGGPGALPFFLVTSFFGSAATFLEVNLCIQHRQKFQSGAILGGPFPYMERLLSPSIAKWYAMSCLCLMMTWSGAQANQLVAILNSPLLGSYRLPVYLTAGAITLFILIILLGGIKRIGAFSSKLVPILFLCYVTACLWILGSNIDRLGAIFHQMFQSLLSPTAIASGTLIGGITSSLRWGIFKGIQACEAGIGTQAIPHSMAETKDPMTQGALAMLSTYTAGILAFITGCVVLVTNTWTSPDLPLGISMMAAAFQQYFSSFGIAILVLSTFLFGFGTILGNSYNGSQCFAYLTAGKKRPLFLIGTALMIFLGAISEVKTFWSFMDLILASMAVPHMIALLRHAIKTQKVVFAK